MRNAEPKTHEPDTTADWADEIAANPPSSAHAAIGPTPDWALRFRDQALERAYLQLEFERGRKIVIPGLAAGLIFLVVMSFVEPSYVSSEHRAMAQAIRWTLPIPAAVIGVIGAVVIKDARLWFPFVTALHFVGALWLCLRILFSGGELFESSMQGLWNLMIAVMFLAGLPLRWSLATCLAFGVAIGTFGKLAGAPTQQLLFFPGSFSMLLIFGAFAVYRYELATRRQFVAQGVSEILARRRIEAESSRRRWLESMTTFLRHELNNRMTAISSSIELAERAAQRAAQAKFLSRARRNTLAMRRLLDRTAHATSVAAALVAGKLERLDLATLVQQHCEDYRESQKLDRNDLQLAVSDPVPVLGDSDALRQMLDKLLNNAVEHRSAASAIQVRVWREGSCGALEVANEGDALPEDLESLFDAFVTYKDRASRADNVGLGLYVARVIAEHHKGTVKAAPLGTHRAGARFIVVLPLRDD